MAGDFLGVPFVQAAGDGGARTQTQMVVIHATDNTASDTAEASYASHRADQISAHFYSDEDSIIQGVRLSHVAYGCYPMGNSRSVQFELCGLSGRLTDATLRRVAPYVRQVCDRYGLPIRHVGPAELRAGAKGICGHGDVTLAWGQGDHTDPGASFPWSTFLGYVAAGTPTPPPPMEEDMFYVIEARTDGDRLIASTGTHYWWVKDASQVLAAAGVPFPTRRVTTAQLTAGFGVEATPASAPVPVTIDAATLAAALQDPATVAAIAKAVNDDAAARLAS